MTTKRIQLIFLIMLIGLFAVPMIILFQSWGTQIGWPWGFYNIVNPGEGTTNFQWIWEVFLNPIGFTGVEYMFYVAMVATIGVAVSAGGNTSTSSYC